MKTFPPPTGIPDFFASSLPSDGLPDGAAVAVPVADPLSGALA
ncbi:hypothetical protein [Streptomyces sp. SID5473]|nr:hypothetical protein [Streptomyces sp. SID5473]